MSGNNTEIVKILKNLSKDVDIIKNSLDVLVASDSKSEDMYKNLNAKLDLFKNLDLESRENIADKKNTKKPTKPSFFKIIFLTRRDQYMDVLYTQDEINAIYATDVVVQKKKPDEQATKAAAMIYLQHIKGNSPPGRTSAFESIYNQEYP